MKKKKIKNFGYIVGILHVTFWRKHIATKVKVQLELFQTVMGFGAI